MISEQMSYIFILQWAATNYVVGPACSLYSVTLLNSLFFFFYHKLTGNDLWDFLEKPFHHLNELRFQARQLWGSPLVSSSPPPG